MQLRNDFRVDVPAERAWTLLNDVELIAPCLPGAQLLEIAGDEYRGVVKVKVGPITAQYKGKASFVEQDAAAGRIVLHASGRDTGGGGNVNATIAATLVPDGDGTRVTVVTDLTITGRLAQFGKGVLSEVSAKLMGQFADCLQHRLLASATTGPGGAVPDEEPGAEPPPPVRRLEGPDVEPVDLFEAARRSLAKRAGPALAALSVLVVGIVWWRRRSRP